MNERIKKQIDFILELDKEKSIIRRSYKTSKERENDAEHSWHMAIMVYLLKEYANKEIDVKKAMLMALVHDVVEIDAGDTYAYDLKAVATQKEREEKAMERIFSLLPDDQKKELKAIFEEFEKCESPEAKFVRSIDNMQPILLNNATDGLSWREHGVKKSQIYKRNEITKKSSEKIWEVIKSIVNKNVEKGNVKDE